VLLVVQAKTPGDNCKIKTKALGYDYTFYISSFPCFVVKKTIILIIFSPAIQFPNK